MFLVASVDDNLSSPLDTGDFVCETFERTLVAVNSNMESICLLNSCLWLDALEQDGTQMGRCYQCSFKNDQASCEATGICFWTDGRDELGGSDCTLCAGRTQQDCEATGYCFWDVEGFENKCSKCPGHMDEASCLGGGAWQEGGFDLALS